MKPILPKGAPNVRCLSATSGGVTTAQNIMALPGTTVLLIPPSVRAYRPTHYQVYNNLATDQTSRSLTLLSVFGADKNSEHQEQNYNSDRLTTATAAINAGLLSNRSSVNDDNNNLESNARKRNHKVRKPRKPRLKATGKPPTCFVPKKAKNVRTRANEINSSACVHSGGVDAFLNDNQKEIESEKNFLDLKNGDLDNRNTVGADFSTPSFNSIPRPIEMQCSSVSHMSQDLYNENSSIETQQTADYDKLLRHRPSHTRSAGFRTGSPPSYEDHVCKVPSCLEGTQMRSNEFTDVIPPPYIQSSQEINAHLSISSSSNLWSSPVGKSVYSSNLTYDSPVNEQLQYNNVNNREADFYSADPTVNLDINYFYGQQLNSRSYDAHSSKYYETFPDPAGWHFENSTEDEPRDYSNSTHDKQLLENINYIEEFVENAEMQMTAASEEKEQSYEERRRLAVNILNINDSESKRKQALRENFWIVEDEPLQHSTDNREATPPRLKSDSTELPLLKPRLSKEFICHICGKMLKGRSSLRSHIHLHLNIKSYECPYCSKRFTQSSVLKNHMRTHTGETPYGCNKCGKAFKTLSILQKHLTKHSKVRAFKCCVCSKCFKTETDLRTHLKVHTSGPHSCSICKKLFDSRSALSSHNQRKHKNQNRFYCSVCNKGYSLRCLLKQHMNVHSSEQKHSCHVCGASYVWKSGLAAHMRTHSFRIQCEICGDKFLSLKKFERHRARHAEPYPHKCPKCDRQFKVPYLLKNHLAKHSDALSCSECGVGFITKTKLKKHLKIHNQSEGQ